MKLVEIVGKNISERRRALGLSQKELAGILDITPDALNRMEKGTIAPKMGRLDAIADALKCPVSTLFHKESAATLERAASIVELLSVLPDEGQKAMLNLVKDAVKVLNNYKK